MGHQLCPQQRSKNEPWGIKTEEDDFEGDQGGESKDKGNQKRIVLVAE